jgi:hypothetical protein
MNYKRILPFVIFIFLQNNLNAYTPSTIMSSKSRWSDVKSCRREVLKGLYLVPLFSLRPSLVKAADRPLTDEEMQEYNKLLKDADRIKNIFDMNINATKEELGTKKENGLEKYIRENNINKIKN